MQCPPGFVLSNGECLPNPLNECTNRSTCPSGTFCRYSPDANYFECAAPVCGRDILCPAGQTCTVTKGQINCTPTTSTASKLGLLFAFLFFILVVLAWIIVIAKSR